MKKIVLVLLAAALLTGCADNAASDTTSSIAETTPVTTPADSEDNIDSLITGKYNNTTVTDEEAALGVTAEKKAAFIAANGYEIYDVAMQSLPAFLHYSQQNSKKLAETDFTSISSKYTVESAAIPSSKGDHTIPLDLISDGNKQKDTVIIIHGLGENRHQSTEQMAMFLQMGYNVLVYDQRGAGENTAPYTTYGVLEHYDTIDCVKHLRTIIGDKKIILFGKSMGGATAAMALGDADTAKEISYTILDFPVGSFRGMVGKNMKGYCPDEYIEGALDWDDLFLQEFLGIRFSMGEVADYVKDTKVPVLVFSSKADDLVPPEQEQGIYDAIKSDKKYIYVDETATHCGLFYTQRELYQSLVTKFLGGELV